MFTYLYLSAGAPAHGEAKGLINIRNNISDDKVKKLYIADFAKRFSLNLNLIKGKNVSNKFVYMLISNSDYGTFIHRFYNNKNYKNEKNDDLIIFLRIIQVNLFFVDL